jgi:hypothetical protein
MRNIYVPLPEPAVEQLRTLAEREYRGAKEQAAVLILDGLRRAGLDPATRTTPDRSTEAPVR